MVVASLLVVRLSLATTSLARSSSLESERIDILELLSFQKKKRETFVPRCTSNFPLGHNMADDSLSASELRNRYHKGGSLADDELSSSQLQARYGQPKNRKEWQKKPAKSMFPPEMVALLFVVAVIILVGYGMLRISM